MKTILRLKILILSLLLITASYSLAQKIETKDGIRIVSPADRLDYAPDIQIVLIKKNEIKTISLKELLPMAFEESKLRKS